MLHGLPGRFQQQTVLGIHRRCLTFAEAEELGIEPGDVTEKGTPLRCRPTRYPRLRVVELVVVPTFGRNLGHKIVAAQQRLPQLLGAIDVAREPTTDPDHRDRDAAL